MARVEPEPVLEDFEELLELLERAKDEDPNSLAFYEDIEERAKDMVKWIETNNVATNNHERAVKNWKDLLEDKLDNLS